jgi:hypothetical protein
VDLKQCEIELRKEPPVTGVKWVVDRGLFPASKQDEEYGVPGKEYFSIVCEVIAPPGQ